MRTASFCFTAALLFYLVFRLSAIGWKTLVTSIPIAPAFYALVLARFFVSPVFQTVIFSILWRRPLQKLLPTFLIKQVFDRDVIDYSGEIYLFSWARKNLPLQTSRILHILKDNTILSSLASVVLATGWLMVFWYFGYITLTENWRNLAVRHIPWIIPCVALGIALYVKSKKSILFLPPRLLWTTFALHILRLLVGQAFLLAQWTTAMPDTPLIKWLTMLAVWIAVIQIPLVPAKELLCIGVGVELSGLLDLPASQTASMLVAAGTLNKAINILIMSIGLFVRHRKPATVTPSSL